MISQPMHQHLRLISGETGIRWRERKRRMQRRNQLCRHNYIWSQPAAYRNTLPSITLAANNKLDEASHGPYLLAHSENMFQREKDNPTAAHMGTRSLSLRIQLEISSRLTDNRENPTTDLSVVLGTPSM